MRDNSLKEWLNSNNFLCVEDDDRKPTHLFLDGGRATIPYDRLGEFYDVYSFCINNKNELFVVETKTDIFRLFADIDFLIEKNSDKQNEYTIIDIVKHIQSVITDLYNEPKKVIICDSQDKKTIKNGKEYIKQGFHLFWRDIYIDRKNALIIRNKCISRLRLIYGERDENNKWDDVFDGCVYKANGIRLNGSYKISRSKNKDTGKSDFKVEYRCYNIMLILNGHDEDVEYTNKLKNSMRNTLEDTTIRTRFTEITDIPNKDVLYEDNDVCDDCEEDTKEEEATVKRVNKNNKKHQEISRYFSIHAPECYKKSSVKSILHMEESDIYIIKTNSSYCQNILRNHNSCGIYFVLSKNGMTQKCYCRCKTLEGRLHGLCSAYSSEYIPCSLHINKLLGWENQKKNPKRTLEKDIVEQALCRKATSYRSQVEMFRSNIYINLIMNS